MDGEIRMAEAGTMLPSADNVPILLTHPGFRFEVRAVVPISYIDLIGLLIFVDEQTRNHSRLVLCTMAWSLLQLVIGL